MYIRMHVSPCGDPCSPEAGVVQHVAHQNARYTVARHSHGVNKGKLIILRATLFYANLYTGVQHQLHV